MVWSAVREITWNEAPASAPTMSCAGPSPRRTGLSNESVGRSARAAGSFRVSNWSCLMSPPSNTADGTSRTYFTSEARGARSASSVNPSPSVILMLGMSGLGFSDFSGLESILYLVIRFGNDFCDDHAGDPRPSINGHRGATTPENSKVWGRRLVGTRGSLRPAGDFRRSPWPQRHARAIRYNLASSQRSGIEGFTGERHWRPARYNRSQCAKFGTLCARLTA